MATADRRTGVSRRGMTVLGKLPISPKPINLPSQRSTFCWGSAGRLQNGGGLPGKFESALLDPVSCDEKFQSKLVTPSGTKYHGGIDLQEKKVQSSSVTARANLSSSGASTTATSMASGTMEEPRKSNTSKSFEIGKKEMTDPLLQKGVDGCARGVSAPPGFPHNGPPGNNSTSSTDSQCNGINNGMHSERSADNGSQSIPGIPYRSGTKDREIIVIHMVGGPGFYGNYPPQFGFPEGYNRDGGMFGNFPLQFGNFEPVFGFQGHGGAHLSPATGSDFFGEHEDFICFEKECFKGACHDIGRKRNSCVHGSYRENSFPGSVQGEGYDSLISSATSTLKSRPLSQRHLSRNAGRLRSLYRTGRVVSMDETTAEPIAEKRITLLTKVSQRDAEAKSTLKEIGGSKDAQISVGPVCSTYLNQEFCEDEGKPPEEIFEARKVTNEIQVETSLPAEVSNNLEMIDDETLPKDCEAESKADLSSKTTCNDNCLHCKGAAVTEGSATLVCQACEKTTVCESNFPNSQSSLEPTEEVPLMTVESDSSVDGCKADVKHVILDADNYSTSTIKLKVVSKEQETVVACKNCSLVSQSGNTEVLEMGSSLSTDTSLTKTAERKQKLVFRKKSQFMWATKSGLRVSKSHVTTKTLGFQGCKLSVGMSSVSSSDTKESAEVVKGQQEDAVERSEPSTTCQLSNSKGSNLKMDTTVSSGAPVKRNAQRQLKLVYRKRVAVQAASGPQPSRNSSKISHPTKSMLVSPQAELELDHEKDEVRQTASASAYKYHIIRRRVYHVVEGSQGDYFLPTAPFSSNDRSKKQLEKVFKKIVPATALSSHRSDSESILLQESGSETKLCGKGTLHTVAPILQASRSPPWPSRQEDNATTKYGKSGKTLSAWKPKVASKTAGSGKSYIGKEREKNSSLSAIVEAPVDKQGSLCSFLVSDLNIPIEGNSGAKHSMGTPDELPSESKSSRCGSTQSGEDNQLSDHAATLLVQEKLVVKVSETAVPEGEAKSGSPKQAGESPPVGPSVHNAQDILAANEVKQTSSEESTVGYSKPFVKKKTMSFEKANHYHQILFRRYKEIGQWKPKANVQKKSVKNKGNARAYQEKAKATG